MGGSIKKTEITSASCFETPCICIQMFLECATLLGLSFDKKIVDILVGEEVMDQARIPGTHCMYVYVFSLVSSETNTATHAWHIPQL